jgi:Tfp pilus assembly protein PilO
MIKIIFGIIIGIVVMYFIYEFIMLLYKATQRYNETKKEEQKAKEDLWRKNLEVDRLKNILEYEKKNKNEMRRKRK